MCDGLCWHKKYYGSSAIKRPKIRYPFLSAGFSESQLKNTTFAYVLWHQDDEDWFICQSPSKIVYQLPKAEITVFCIGGMVSVAKICTNKWLYGMIRRKSKVTRLHFREQEEKVNPFRITHMMKKVQKDVLEPLAWHKMQDAAS